MFDCEYLRGSKKTLLVEKKIAPDSVIVVVVAVVFDQRKEDGTAQHATTLRAHTNFY
jgi:hypothetical protein